MKFISGTILTPPKHMKSVYDMELVLVSEKVTKHTRASRNGKQITCPQCNTTTTVYHFAWSALGCQHCGSMVDKYEWKLL